MASSSWTWRATSCSSSVTDGLWDQGQLTSLLYTSSFSPFPPTSLVQIPTSPNWQLSSKCGLKLLELSWTQVTSTRAADVPSLTPPACPHSISPDIQLKTKPSQMSSLGELGPGEGGGETVEWFFLYTAPTHPWAIPARAHARRSASSQWCWRHFIAIPSTPIPVGFTWPFI